MLVIGCYIFEQERNGVFLLGRQRWCFGHGLLNEMPVFVLGCHAADRTRGDPSKHAYRPRRNRGPRWKGLTCSGDVARILRETCLVGLYTCPELHKHWCAILGLNQ